VTEKLQRVHRDVCVCIYPNKRVSACEHVDAAVDEVIVNLTMGATRATVLLWLVRSIGDGQLQAM
jgi:hypothetical protein